MNVLSIFMKAFVAIVCFSVTFLIVEGWIGLLLGLLFGALSLVLVGMLTNDSDNTEICRMNGRVNRFPRLKLLLLVPVFAVSISSFYFVSPMQNQVYVPPENILLANWVRHVCAILTTTFVPGYLILDLIDLNQAIRGLNKILFSYILSIFSTFLLGYIIILSGNSINQLGTFGISILNVSLLITYIFFLLKRRLGNRQLQEANYFKSAHILNRRKLYTAAFWILMICFIVVLTYIRYGPQIISDQRDYYGLAISLESIKLPQGASAFPSSPWLFGVYLAMLFCASGAPSVNAYNSLNFLNIMPLIAFFVLTKTFFKNHAHVDTIAVLSTFFAFLTSGFGWIYTLRDALIDNTPLSEAIYLSWIRTYDILTPNSFITAGHPDVTTPLLLIGLPSMFALFQLSVSSRKDDRLKYLLIIAVAVLGYLGHTETIIMISTVAIVALTKKDGLKTLISLLAASAMIFVIVASSPDRFYINQGITLAGQFISFPSLLAAVFMLLACIRLTLQVVKNTSFLIKLRTMAKRMLYSVSASYGVLFLSSLIFFVYVFAFVVWGIVQAGFNTRSVFGYDGSVPWYFYPIRLGVIGCIAIIGVLYWLLSEKWRSMIQLFPFYVWMLVTIVVQPYYLEYRLIKHFYIPVSVIAGFALCVLASRVSSSSFTVRLERTYQQMPRQLPSILNVRICGKHIVAVVLLVITVTSVASNLLSIRAVDDSDYPPVLSVLPRQSFTEEELKALTWLKFNIAPMNDTVLYLPDGRNLGSEVEEIGGAWDVLSRRFAPFFAVSRPDDFFDLCRKMRAKYLYLNWEDRSILNSNEEYANSFVKQLLDNLPVVFNNSKVTIYEFPSFASPVKLSSTAFVLPSPTLPITTLGLTDLNYSIISNDDPATSNYNALILPSYPSPEELDEYTEWAGNGGQLVAFSFPPNPALERSYGASNGAFYGLNPLYGNWSAIGNEIFASTSGDILSNETMTGDYVVSTYAHVVQVLDPADNHLGLLFNYQDSNNYYYAFLRDELFVLYKEYNGTGREYYYADVDRSNDAFQKLTIQVEFPVLRFYVDNVYVGKYSDPQFIASGRLGLRTYHVTGQFRAINATVSPSEYVPVNGIAGKKTSIQIPEIEVPLINETMLSGETISLDAYYTMDGEKVLPFAFTVDAGKGNMTCVNLPPLFDFMEISSDQEGKRLLFSKLGGIFESLELNLPTQRAVSNVGVELICFVRGVINSTGEVALKTDSFWFIDQKPLSGTIDFSNTTTLEITKGNEIPSENHPFNATILEYQTSGLTKTAIQTSYVTTTSLGSGTYSTFEIPDNFTMVTNLANGATANLTLLIDKSLVKLAIYGGSIAIDIFNTVRDTTTSNYENTLQICAKYPALQLTGRTFMEHAYLSTSPFSVLAYGYPVIISGTTSFQIENIDQGIIRISNFLINGELSSQKPEKMWNEWNIPWMQVFTSVYGLLFFILAIVVIFMFTKICFPSRKRNDKEKQSYNNN